LQIHIVARSHTEVTKERLLVPVVTQHESKDWPGGKLLASIATCAKTDGVCTPCLKKKFTHLASYKLISSAPPFVKFYR